MVEQPRIFEHEFDLAMMIVKNNYPNVAFVIDKFVHETSNREKERLLAIIKKWKDDHWIPHPTHADSFWQNQLLLDLERVINEG